MDCYNINNGQYYYGGRGAALSSTYTNDFNATDIDVLKDSNSPYKGSPMGWKNAIGAPTVNVNDVKLDKSFDNQK